MRVVPRDFSPTNARPGSPEKIEILAERSRLGFPLWHPDDEKIAINYDADEERVYTQLPAFPGVNIRTRGRNRQDFFVSLTKPDGDAVVKVFPISAFDDVVKFVEEFKAHPYGKDVEEVMRPLSLKTKERLTDGVGRTLEKVLERGTSGKAYGSANEDDGDE